MAIDDVKQSIIENVTNAYNTVDAKGGAITGAKNLENLSDSIDSIVTGTVIGYHVRSVINDDGETQTLKISAGKLPEGELSITENGRYDVADYAEAVVDVPSEEPVLIDKTITENGEYSASADGADGYSNVSVNVAGLIPSGTLSISANGIYDVVNYASANVNIAAQGDAELAKAYLPVFTKFGSAISDPFNIVTYLGYYGLASISGNLSNITLPVCSSVSASAFYRTGTSTTPLTINLPACTYIDSRAFYYCNATEINLPVCKSAWFRDGYYFEQASYLQTVNMPVYSEALRVGCFQNCSNLLSVNIPKCTSIGQSAFKNCYKLQSVDFPEVTAVDAYAFTSCSSLTTVNLPKLVGWLGNYAFWYCTKLESVYMPNVKALSVNAFAHCARLKEFNAPLCSFISGGNNFYNCGALSKVNLENVETFGTNDNYAFGGCGALKSLNIPKCSLIGGKATFNSCSALSVLILGSSCALGGSTLFSYTPMVDSSYLGYYGSIYVPADYVDSYKTSTNWSYFADRITSIDNLPAE